MIGCGSRLAHIGRFAAALMAASAVLPLPLIGPSGAEESSAASRCREAVSSDTVRAANAEEIALASGARIRIVDLRFPAALDPRALAWLTSLAGQAVTVAAVGEPDRWERVPARVALAGTPAIDLADLLVGEGLAVVDAGLRDELCRPGLLAVEGVARDRKRGLWERGAWPVQARDLEALAASAGRFTIVEGRVVGVGERRERTYLNFGRDWSRDFSVTIPRRTWASLKARGVTADSLTGRTVRVRGIVEVRRAPSLDIASPDMLERPEVGSRPSPENR